MFGLSQQTQRWLIFIFVMALLVRLPGIAWGYGAFGEQRLYNQVDELVQIRIAKEILSNWGFTIKDQVECMHYSCIQWYGRLYPMQVAILSLPILAAQAIIPSIGDISFNGLIYIPGRILSVLYGAATCILVFFIIRRLTGREWVALTGAAFFAVINLDVINSMVMKPHTALVFYWWLGVLLFLIHWERMDLRAASLILSTAVLAFVSKFAIEPFFWILPILYLAYKQRHLSWRWLLLPVLLFIVFQAANGFDYGPSRFNKALDQLGIRPGIDPNTGLQLPPGSNLGTALGGIPSYNHTLTPFLYFLALIPGVGLPLFIAGIVGIYLLIRSRWRWNVMCIIMIPFALMILRLSMGTATFERFIHPITPLFAIGAAYLLHRVLSIESGSMWRWGKLAIALVLIYSLGMVAFTEYYYLHDPRLEGGAWISKHIPRNVDITASGTASFIGVPAGYDVTTKTTRETLKEVYAVHEAAYRRYLKSFTTPFKTPRCCDEVYNCDKLECSLIQEIFAGQTDYYLAAEFVYSHPYPEMALFKHYFGSYESFIGDYKIFVKHGTPVLP